jgi:GT2 family glycosyltransferase
MNSCWIVIPVHNRKQTTLACLRRLDVSDVFSWASVVVVDDGSTDKTEESIVNEFPGVYILKGDGSLWWTGAIAKGMEFAYRRGAQVTIWLNDDCRPVGDCLHKITEYCFGRKVIAVAQAKTPTGYTYGGRLQTKNGLQEVNCNSSEIAICHTFSGNCVAIPREVVAKIGFPNAEFLPHSLADSHYGLLARNSGFPIHVLGAALCENDDNLSGSTRSWLLSDVSLLEIWRSLFNLKSSLHLKSNWNFYVSNWKLRGIVLFGKPYVRLALITMIRTFTPRKILLRFYQNRSTAWKSEKNFQKANAQENKS